MMVLEKKIVVKEILKFGEGFLEGFLEHTFTLPTAVRKDAFYMSDSWNSKNAGYVASFSIGNITAMVPTIVSILIPIEVYSFLEPLAQTQIAAHTISLLYEVGRGIYKGVKSKKN
jgi:hypothetical protein